MHTDLANLKLPSFLGDLMKAQVSSAVLKLSHKKAFRGAHFGISIHGWNHIVAIEKAHGQVPGKTGCAAAGQIFLSISSSSTETYKLSDLLGALGVNVDPGVGDSSIFRDLELSDLAAVVRGTISDFGLVLSASAKYRDLNMQVVVAVAGLGTSSRPVAAIKLAVLNEDALNKVLSYIGVPVESILPDMVIGNLQIVGATREFQANRHCGLEDYMRFGADIVPAGLHFNLDIGWKSCNQFLCKGWAKIMPGENGLPRMTRLQGGATMKGFTFNLGEMDLAGTGAPSFGWKYTVLPRVPGTTALFPSVPSVQIKTDWLKSPSLPGLGGLEELGGSPLQIGGFAFDQELMGKAWPTIKLPLPLTWTFCQGSDLNLKALIGFEFAETRSTDTCIGFIETSGARRLS